MKLLRKWWARLLHEPSVPAADAGVEHPRRPRVLVDEAMLAYLRSNAPEPSQAALEEVLVRSRRVRVFRGGAVAGKPLKEEVVLDTDEVEAISSLREALRITDGPAGHCMCHGDMTIELMEPSGSRLAVIGVHHGRTIRWNEWKDDAELIERGRLLDWLTRHGVAYPWM